MAAETLTSSRAAGTAPVPENHIGGLLHAHWGSYAVAANVEDGDIFEMHYVPDAAVIVDGVVRADDMDTGAEALDMDVGWAANNSDSADPDGLGNLGVWTGDAVTDNKPEASILYPYNGTLKDGPKQFTAGGGKTMIQVEANVAATTFAAGDLTITTYYLVP